MIPAYPRIPNDVKNQYIRYELDYMLWLITNSVCVHACMCGGEGYISNSVSANEDINNDCHSNHQQILSILLLSLEMLDEKKHLSFFLHWQVFPLSIFAIKLGRESTTKDIKNLAFLQMHERSYFLPPSAWRSWSLILTTTPKRKKVKHTQTRVTMKK